jgi:hypothetical protein
MSNEETSKLNAKAKRTGGDEAGNSVYPCNFLTGTWNIKVQCQHPEINWGYNGTLKLTMAQDCSGVSSAIVTFPKLWTGQSVTITLQETTMKVYQPANPGIGAYYDIYILTLYGYTQDYSAELVLTFSTGSFEFGYVSGEASLWSYGSQQTAQYNGQVSGSNPAIRP